VPELTSYLNGYTSAPDPSAKKFAAIYAWLHFPGMQPEMTSGMGRGLPLDEQDSYRDNWWCNATLSEDGVPVNPGKQAPKESPSFLTAAQLATAEKEVAMISAIGAVPNFFCQQAIQWATQHPTDRRAPEALHFAVKSTRYGCTNKQTGKWSKAAYDFLHRRYPGNTWTKQTPYWFKD
jgi:hypothetical protein